MPSIDIAMAQSVARRRTLLDVIVAATQPIVYRRGVADVEQKFTNVKTAFSSWDNCMKADLCKWPVIAIIIIGGLFILSIVWCIARCACCGLSCCCECCYCLKCCGNCCGCCDPPRGKKSKYLDEPYVPPNQGYHSEAPMNSGIVTSAKAPPFYDKPQFAKFDVSKPGAAHTGEDALPAMPSWESSNNTKVYVEEEPMEMNNLNKLDTASQKVPLMATTSVSPGPHSPSPMGSPSQHSPYAPPRMNSDAGMDSSHGAVSNGYLAAGAIPRAASAGPYGRNSPGGYIDDRQNSASELGSSYGYNAPNMVSGRQPSPSQYSNNWPQQPGRGNQGGDYDNYRRNGTSPPIGQQAFAMDNRSPRIPELGSVGYDMPGGPGVYGAEAAGPYGGGPNASGRSPVNGRPMNNRPPPQRQYSGSTANGSNNGYSGGYGGGYSGGYGSYGGGTANDSYGAGGNSGYGAPVSPTLQNSGGFDFSSGNSRPMNIGNSPPPLSHTQPPQPEQAGYPGYRSYRGL